MNELNRKSSDIYKIVTPLLKTYKENETLTKKISAKKLYSIRKKDPTDVGSRNNILQILILLNRIIVLAVKTILNILLTVLATIGLAALIFPDIRIEVIKTGTMILLEFKKYMNIG